jgi:hypothetical protein
MSTSSCRRLHPNDEHALSLELNHFRDCVCSFKVRFCLADKQLTCESHHIDLLAFDPRRTRTAARMAPPAARPLAPRPLEREEEKK